MKSPFSNLRSLLVAVALTAVPTLALSQAGCAASHAMRSGDNVAGAVGSVRATEGLDGNTAVTIRVKHLATPSKVEGDATIYVVWFQPKDGEVQNVGSMTVNDQLEGRFDGATPHSRFEVSVTPEPSGQVALPSHSPVFTAHVDRE